MFICTIELRHSWSSEVAWKLVSVAGSDLELTAVLVLCNALMVEELDRVTFDLAVSPEVDGDG